VVGDGVQLVVEQVPAEASDRRVYLNGQSLDILAFGRWSPMTKRLVDIDDSDLQAAQEALATRTIKETVGQALRDAAAAAARRREIQRLTAGSLAGLADKEERTKLWP
jgi:Arc/MetJ family transcription regulator